jgi:hypothetical protein
MFAGERFTFHHAIRFGDALRRETELKDISVKTGGTGTLVFATTLHRIFTADGPAIEEERRTVFREEVKAGERNQAPRREEAPADAPWRPLIEAALTRVGAPVAPALSDDAMAAARDMSEADRGTMVRGMVDRLAARLKQDGSDVEGWLRLVRAYMVMGERDKATSARTEARQAVAGDAERLRQLNEGLKNLGLDG